MLSNLKIKNKLLSLFLLPLVAVIILVSIIIVALYKDYENSVNAASTYEIKQIGNLIHQMQIERGLSAGYLASKGEKNKDKIINQRKNVDEVVQVLVEFQKNQQITTAQKILKELNEKRKAIDSFSLTVPQSGVYYTDNIYKFLEYYREILQKSEIPQIKNELLSHYWLIFAKENLGQMRANLNAIFINNEFNGDSFAKVGANKVMIETLFNNFEKDASEEVVRYFKSKYQGNDIEQINKMVSLAFEKNKEGNFNIESSVWFNTATKTIEILKDIEDFSISYIEQEMNSNISNIFDKILIFIIGSVILILLNIFLYMRISSNIVTSTNNFKEGLLSFFSYLNRESLDVKFLDDKVEDEFGEMAKVINENIEKTQKLIIQDYELIEDVKRVVNEVKHGRLDQRIIKRTQNQSLEELKNTFNEMIENTSSNVAQDINKLLNFRT